MVSDHAALLTAAILLQVGIHRPELLRAFGLAPAAVESDPLAALLSLRDRLGTRLEHVEFSRGKNYLLT